MGPARLREKGLQEWVLSVWISSHVNDLSQIGSSAMDPMASTGYEPWLPWLPHRAALLVSTRDPVQVSGKLNGSSRAAHLESGNTTPRRMTGVTLHSHCHVRYKEI